MCKESATGGVATAEFNEGCGKRYEEAKKSFRSLAQALVCYNVCCLGEWATYVTPIRAVLDGYSSDADRGVLRAAQSQPMARLRDGLDDLAKHFRFPR